jgi:adenine-specific DNA-methyltransferase
MKASGTPLDVIEGRSRWANVQADALRFLRSLPDAQVDLICVDPPYYRVAPCAWDRQWRTREDYLDWLRLLCHEWRRLLRPTGSVYVFASTPMSARVELVIDESFAVLNRIAWRKPACSTRAHRADRSLWRRYYTGSEAIIFAEQHDQVGDRQGRSFIFEPIRAYLDGERRRAGMTYREVERALGRKMSCHYFGRTQWELPSRVAYKALQDFLNSGGNATRRLLEVDYEFLRRSYEDLLSEHQALRRAFSVAGAETYTDVWEFKAARRRQGHPKHPCEKPSALIAHIIRASSRPNDVVLDCFAGSGVTGEQAILLGRRFLGSERDRTWQRNGSVRIAAAALAVEGDQLARAAS